MLLDRYQEKTPECGTDEAGRGCLAGPVTAAAVILPDDIRPDIINDSKQLTAEQRNKMALFIKENALSYGIAHVSPKKIDEMNILQASILAMHLAIDKLEHQPVFISVDGNKFNTYKDIPHACIIKGDGKYLNIAAASILAKKSRDDLMLALHEEHPEYNWKKNKGYPTQEHIKAIEIHGKNTNHRKSFQLKRQLKLSF